MQIQKGHPPPQIKKTKKNQPVEIMNRCVPKQNDIILQ